MWEGLLKREVLVDFMGFESVFGFVEATELFAVEGVFMGGVLLGCGRMLWTSWVGKFSSAGPLRDAAHERNVEGGSFHGGGGEVTFWRQIYLFFIWPQGKFYYFLLRFSAASNGNQISRSRCAWGIVGREVMIKSDW